MVLSTVRHTHTHQDLRRKGTMGVWGFPYPWPLEAKPYDQIEWAACRGDGGCRRGEAAARWLSVAKLFFLRRHRIPSTTMYYYMPVLFFIPTTHKAFLGIKQATAMYWHGFVIWHNVTIFFWKLFAKKCIILIWENVKLSIIYTLNPILLFFIPIF